MDKIGKWTVKVWYQCQNFLNLIISLKIYKNILVRKYTLKYYTVKRPNIYNILSNDSRNIYIYIFISPVVFLRDREYRANVTKCKKLMKDKRQFFVLFLQCFCKLGNISKQSIKKLTKQKEIDTLT